MSLQALNVTKMYGLQRALDDVSFSIDQGEVVALLGPNGAGKSTMMKIIACYLSQTAGKVSVCGYDVNKQPLAVKQKLGYLPENNPLYTDMYVKEYLLFVAGLHRLGKASRQRVDEMVEVVGLVSEYKKPISALSKGYRQRVGIAQALIHDPEVLILDEPTAGLDPNQLAEVRQLIREAGKDKTVIFSTHIMQEVEAVCNRVIIINKGKIIADAPTGEVRLLNRASRVVLVEFNREADLHELKAMDGVMEVVRESATSFRLFTGSGHDVRAELFRYAVDRNMVILTMQQLSQSLEEVFREMTV